jgi:hypothetical protein
MTRKETATMVVIYAMARRVAGADSVSLSTAIEIRLKLKETALYIYTHVQAMEKLLSPSSSAVCSALGSS